MVSYYSCTGIQDAISFPDYHCFASNQTGNTVFLLLASKKTPSLLFPHSAGFGLPLFLHTPETV
jgi:hypothetical protein